MHLAKVFCGDEGYTPYIKGQELVMYFNKYGFNDIYEQGFPSRWKYTEEKLRQLNGTEAIRQIIEDTVDPRRYHGLSLNYDDAARKLNDVLKYDAIQLKQFGSIYKVVDTHGSLVQPETSKEINHDFVNEQIKKCQSKIDEGDFNGAITNARTLIEAIFIEIIERHEGLESKNDGDIDNLWKKVRKIMKLEVDKQTLPEYVIQILSGLDTAIRGLAGLANNAGDRHATKFKTRKHHAKLGVNLAMTIADFLLDSWNYQTNKEGGS